VSVPPAPSEPEPTPAAPDEPQAATQALAIEPDPAAVEKAILPVPPYKTTGSSGRPHPSIARARVLAERGLPPDIVLDFPQAHDASVDQIALLLKNGQTITSNQDVAHLNLLEKSVEDGLFPDIETAVNNTELAGRVSFDGDDDLAPFQSQGEEGTRPLSKEDYKGGTWVQPQAKDQIEPDGQQ
jgi:hypothetical protein